MFVRILFIMKQAAGIGTNIKSAIFTLIANVTIAIAANRKISLTAISAMS